MHRAQPRPRQQWALILLGVALLLLAFFTPYVNPEAVEQTRLMLQGKPHEPLDSVNIYLPAWQCPRFWITTLLGAGSIAFGVMQGTTWFRPKKEYEAGVDS